jgi:hypothetical protein
MIAELKTSIAAAYAAINSGDYVTALRHARAARTALIVIPEADLLGEKIKLTQEFCDSWIKDLDAQANAQLASETDALASNNPFGIQTIRMRTIRR